jgi:hypothetical protein
MKTDVTPMQRTAATAAAARCAVPLISRPCLREEQEDAGDLGQRVAWQRREEALQELVGPWPPQAAASSPNFTTAPPCA